METFSALLAISAGNSPVSGEFPAALIFSLICVWIKGWVNNREAGGLRRYRAHYDGYWIKFKIYLLQFKIETHLSLLMYVQGTDPDSGHDLPIILKSNWSNCVNLL